MIVEQQRRSREKSRKKQYYSNIDKKKSQQLLRHYGITKDQWLQLYEFQKGCCMICGKRLRRWLDNDGGKIASLDHSHVTGLIRGLLCKMPCNRKLVDDTNLLQLYLSYTTNPPAVKLFGAPIYTAPGKIGTKVRTKLLNKLKAGDEKTN